MSTTSQQLAGDISLLDEAVIKYHAAGHDFIAMLDYFLNYRPPAKRYVYSAPDYLMLFQELTDEEHGTHWSIAYAACRSGNPIKLLMDLAPYKLDTVAFSRYRHLLQGRVNEFKYYNWDKLYKHGRIIQITKGSANTPTSAAASAAAAAPSSCASTEAADSSGEA